MAFRVEFREPDAYGRSYKHFETLDTAKEFVLSYIKDHKDFYKHVKNIDTASFTITPDFEYGKKSKVYRYIADENYYDNPKYIEFDEDLVDNFIYRGIPINIYEDDYGQCYYFKFIHNGELIEDSCGGWNPDYKTAVTDAIDYLLDRGV